MTNFEWLLENEKDLVKCLMLGSQLAKKNGKPVLCESICCGDCDWVPDCESDFDNECTKKWLDEEYKEPSPYDNWEIDDPIEVSSNGRDWCKAHFAGVNENGLPLSWGSHGTSWSCGNNDSRKIWWNYARKVEE